ncbi:MAG: hypothetical protein LBT68_07405 [Spirochaetales bacterium]|jgi:hypothetical protein|nr:hypothetical protein [Spirochaetales bacterium]
MKKLIAIILLCSPAAFLAGQMADEMDRVLGAPEISYSQAARFVLPAAGELPDKADLAGAFAAARGKGWIPAEALPEAAIRLDELSFLIMSAFDISGGLMYSFFPGPRYAYRDMRHESFLPADSDPDFFVSGENLFTILGKVMDGVEPKPAAEEPVRFDTKGEPKEILPKEIPVGQEGIRREAVDIEK